MDRYPCDPKYIEALGRAVYNFAVLEYNVACIIERLGSGYLVDEYISEEKKTAVMAATAAVTSRGRGSPTRHDATARTQRQAVAVHHRRGDVAAG